MATPTAAPVLMGRDATGTAGAVEKADEKPMPRIVAGIVARPNAAAIMIAPETEDETGTETAIGAVENATGAESRMTTAGPVIEPSTRSVAASVRASAGIAAGVPTRSSGPSKRSRRGRALGSLSR